MLVCVHALSMPRSTDSLPTSSFVRGTANDKLWIWVTVGSIGGLLVIGVIVGGIGLVLVHRRRQAAQYTTV